MDFLTDYDYELPERLIAQTPLDDRAASRLLVLRKQTGEIEHRMFRDVVDLLTHGDLLVLNDTRVSGVRLFGNRESGGSAELLLLEEIGEGEYRSLAKPAKKLRVGSRISIDGLSDAVVVREGAEGIRDLRFDEAFGLREKLQEFGTVPLPPYIHESLERKERYQTVYGCKPGSSAAPTAGLHFTQEILDRLAEKGVRQAFVTLHVGIDTFRPVQVEDLQEHQMHGERCSVPEETAEAIATCPGRVIAVGTTTVRTLESFATGPRKVTSGEKVTSIFIRSGHQFLAVDGMFTNFHLPRTTMLVMLAALAGKDNLDRAYGEALSANYRFLSFGDSMLVI